MTLILDRKFSVKERLKIVSSVTTCVMDLLFSVQYQIKICQIWPSFVLYVHVCSLIVCAITRTLYINIYLHIISYTIYISNVSFFWHIFYIFMMNNKPWNVLCFPFVYSTLKLSVFIKWSLLHRYTTLKKREKIQYVLVIFYFLF